MPVWCWARVADGGQHQSSVGPMPRVCCWEWIPLDKEAAHRTPLLPRKAKMRYILTCKVNKYCLLALESSLVLADTWQALRARRQCELLTRTRCISLQPSDSPFNSTRWDLVYTMFTLMLLGQYNYMRFQANKLTLNCSNILWYMFCYSKKKM